jgi:ribosomal RNA-processing protein 1
VGLAFHIADVYLEELDKVLQPGSSSPATPVPLSVILATLLALLAQTPNKSTREHLHSAVLVPLLAALKPAMSTDRRKRPRVETFSNVLSNACLDDPGSEGPLGQDQLQTGLLKILFEIAAQEETRPPNRKFMLSTYREYKDEDTSDLPAP